MARPHPDGALNGSHAQAPAEAPAKTQACANATRRRFISQRAPGLVLAAAWPAFVGLQACSARKPIRGQAVAAGSTVLALGDSLTHGTGAGTGPGGEPATYPAVLARLTGWQVINAGVPGDTTAQALARTPPLLEEHRPSLVLLGIGGNDFLRRMDEGTTRANLQRTCELVRDSGAQLLLIAVPRPTLAAKFTGSLTDHPMYGELAEALRIPLHRQGWAEVLGDERLKSDAIHANAAGYEQFARGLAATARAAGLLVG